MTGHIGISLTEGADAGAETFLGAADSARQPLTRIYTGRNAGGERASKR